MLCHWRVCKAYNMRTNVVFAILLAWQFGEASAATLHTCPIVGPFGATVPIAGPDAWNVHMPRGEIEMYARGEMIYCKYAGLLVTKKVDPSVCVLGSEGGRITAPPKFPESTVCTFRDEITRKPRDCFVICQ
jgi:hypothetical protein